jgi:CRISPR/Cas system-associated protein endoribonuclease Cas2
MAEQISTIRQSILNKAKKDKFLLVFTLPKALRMVNTRDNSSRLDEKLIHDSLQFSIFGTIIPAITVNAIEETYSGQVFKFSGHHRPSYGNITVNFVIDNQFNNYWVIYKWINLMNHNKEAFFHKDQMPLKDAPFEDYATNFTVFGLDEYDNKKIQFDYIGVVPVSLGSINYNYQDPTQIDSTFEFSFSQLTSQLL